MAFLDYTGLGYFKGKLDEEFVAASEKGANSGIATLDANGLVPTTQLPGSYDNIDWFASTSAFPLAGVADKMYVALDTNRIYRWDTDQYVEVSKLDLGETSVQAYRGDRGKTAYDHATDASRLTTVQTSGLYKFATTAEGHIASVTEVQKSDITGLGIPAQDTTYSVMTGATSSAAGTSGLTPIPTAGKHVQYLKGDGTWDSPATSELGLSVSNGKIMITYQREVS